MLVPSWMQWWGWAFPKAQPLKEGGGVDATMGDSVSLSSLMQVYEFVVQCWRGQISWQTSFEAAVLFQVTGGCTLGPGSGLPWSVLMGWTRRSLKFPSKPNHSMISMTYPLFDFSVCQEKKASLGHFHRIIEFCSEVWKPGNLQCGWTHAEKPDAFKCQ